MMVLCIVLFYMSIKSICRSILNNLKDFGKATYFKGITLSVSSYNLASFVKVKMILGPKRLL